MKSDLVVSEKGLTFLGETVFGLHWDTDCVWIYHPDRGEPITPDERWWKTEDGMDAMKFAENIANEITENFGHIELDLPDDDEEEPEEYTQEELRRLTEEWESSGSNLPFEVWLTVRRNTN